MSASPSPTTGPDRMDLDLRVEWEHDVATITIGGDVDHHTCKLLRNVAHGALAAGARSLVLDCREVPFMDSGGVSVLADVASHTRKRGGGVEVRAPQRGVRRVLEVCGLDHVVSITSITDGRPQGAPLGEG